MTMLTFCGKSYPHCGSQDTRRSRRKLLEFFLMVLLLWSHRSRVCGTRFWRFV
jgi:hypothetical protein